MSFQIPAQIKKQSATRIAKGYKIMMSINSNYITMNTESYKNIFHGNFSDYPDFSLPKLPNRIDSCPPSPVSRFQADFSFPDFEDPDPFFTEKPSLFLSFPQDDSMKKTNNEEGEGIIDNPNASKRKTKSKRKDKAKDSTLNLETEEESKKKRAEKNRKFAKESRDRKRKYVQELEQEVTRLKQQVEYYKTRLSKYDLIEKQRNTFAYEFYATISNVYKEMYEKKQSVTDTALFVKTLEAKFDQCLEERRKALEQLARAMVEVIMPLSTKITMWIAEKNMDVYDPEKVAQAMSPDISLEQAKVLVKYTKMTFPDRKKHNEMQVFMAASGKRIKLLVKQLIECQKKAQVELQKVGQYLKKNVLPNYNVYMIDAFMKAVTHITAKPELSDYAIYQIKDGDFRVEGTAFTEEDTEIDKVPDLGESEMQMPSNTNQQLCVQFNLCSFIILSYQL
eukprot:TRINITY_DN15_c0_g1_i1.p2 TRINITY_DN15_c0_g1~~TRINITY_DN15_c0_g1_i1.p2  ORF type:complete len:450 (+),score=61.99 TRINITY_DN15_c0_g1_i1:2762-4111(+)